jgi:hypothetical protein
MSRESEEIAALRNRLAGAESTFELTRCHFEAHALLKKFPGSVEGRLLLEQIERALRAQDAETAPPAQPRPPSPWRSALRPLPWAVALVVFAYFMLYFLRRYLR